MFTYCLRRGLLALLLVWAVASGAFVLTRLAPGDFVTGAGLELSPDEAARERARLGLDRPLPVQYAAWLRGVLRFDFGTSFSYARPVGSLIAERAVNTAILAVAALMLATLLGVPLGIYTALRPSGAGSLLARGVSLVLLSTPPLVASLALVVLATRTGWAPPGGMTSANGESGFAWWLDVARHLPVPALALALPLAATLERLQSQAMTDALARPFVAAARARGASALQSWLRHAWINALGPLLGMYGLMIGALLSGSFVVEAVTAWPGLGRLMVDALQARDLYLVAGGAAAGAAGLALGTFVTDVAHGIVDPRVRQAR
ncbi:MAG: ABC transporter permease [Acidobacteria bacterium]|nr:ABC transporter permease [Acidobacteriota bacterium]